MKTADGYIRVSRVGKREGESFISPSEQRKAIEAWASSTGTTILEWHEDLDESGGTLDRPAFRIALERCRKGIAGGIVAAKLDRLTRSVAGLASLLDDAREHDFNLVALDLGLDLHSPNGELVANVLGSVAQWERKRRRDDWAVAQRNAVERGVPNGRAPFGYRKRPDKRLEVVNADAAKVVDAFERRAAGEAYTRIGRRHGWAHSTVRQMLTNEAYLGVARSGQNINEHAHPAIVTRARFEAANAARTKQPIPPGETTRNLLLQGLARCAGCGHTLKAKRRRRADGTHVQAYYCNSAATEPCGDRAYVHTDDLDAYVSAWFTEALRSTPRMIDVVAAGRELEAAQAEQERAEAELDVYNEQQSALDDAALFRRGIAKRQAVADAARAHVGELSRRITRLPSGGSLLALWDGFTVAERRDVLHGFIGRVEVQRSASSDLVPHVQIF